MLEDPDDAIRREVTVVLGSIGDERARALLVRSLEDADSQVRWRAALGLGRVREPATTLALEERLSRETDPEVEAEIRRALRSVTIKGRPSATEAREHEDHRPPPHR